MEQLLPVLIGVIAAFIVFKMLKGVVKLILLAVIVALVAALYFGMGA